MPEKPPILTIKESAELARVNERTIRRWIQLGRLHPMRKGGTVRISRRDLLGALEKYEFGASGTFDPSMG